MQHVSCHPLAHRCFLSKLRNSAPLPDLAGVRLRYYSSFPSPVSASRHPHPLQDITRFVLLVLPHPKPQLCPCYVITSGLLSMILKAPVQSCSTSLPSPVPVSPLQELWQNSNPGCPANTPCPSWIMRFLLSSTPFSRTLACPDCCCPLCPVDLPLLLG